MKILIADDERLARERIAYLLDDCLEDKQISMAKNGFEAVKMCKELGADLVFLDIRMPGMDGIEAAQQLSQLNEPPAIIFTTAYGEFALDAFEVQAVDYLLKPIKSERLQKSLESAGRLNKAQLQTLSQSQSFNNLQQTPESSQAPATICVQHRGSIERIDLNDIFYFLAEHKYISVFHRGGESLLEDTLKQLEEQYAENFIRVHRNALVNKLQIVSMQKDDDGVMRLSLKDTPQRLDVSQRMVPFVRRFMQQG